MKMTLISIVYRGMRYSSFSVGKVNADGTVSVPQSEYEKLLDAAGCPRGGTYTVG